jgi:hypothetical protein
VDIVGSVIVTDPMVPGGVDAELNAGRDAAFRGCQPDFADLPLLVNFECSVRELHCVKFERRIIVALVQPCCCLAMYSLDWE